MKKSILYIVLVFVVGVTHAQQMPDGIKGEEAPALLLDEWFDGDGNEMDQVDLYDFTSEEKYVVMMFYFNTCHGCHEYGLPDYKQIIDAFEGDDRIQFLAVQTVMGAPKKNQPKHIIKTQKKYDIHIPFGHDYAEEDGVARLMKVYDAVGTPWYVVINPEGKVIYNHYTMVPEEGIALLKSYLE